MAKAMVATALMVVAGVAHAGDSAKMVLDLRTGPRASGGDETLLFSSLWDGGADATVTIAQDGVAIAKNLAGEGERAWSVPYNGTYELTHVTYTNGVAGKVETAKFVVTGKKNPPVPYWDPTTCTTNLCLSYTFYTGQATLESGWYVVTGDITNDTRITVSGDVNLILCDGASLTANAGVNVGVDGTTTNSLTVWAQSDGAGMGRLTAQGSLCAAGIGGGEYGSGGTVTVNGGEVTAQGGKQAAGIGGGYSGTGGTVTVNGGVVTATGGDRAAGIGGAWHGTGGTVAVNGGTVVAAGHGAIGRGAGSSVSGDLFFPGMKVYAAEGGDPVAATDRMAACRREWVKLEVCAPHAFTAGVDNGDSHSVCCAFCGALNGVTEPHTFAKGLCAPCGTTVLPSVSNVVARQRWPWNGLVDVDYEVGGYTEGLTARISFAEQGGAGRHWVATNFLDGVTPSAEPGPHRATWDAAADGATNVAAAVVATVELVRTDQLISPTPVTPDPTESARKLYSFLRENYGRKVISGVMTERPFENNGQYTPHGYETQTELKYVHDASGKNVVVVGLDFLHTTGKDANEGWNQGYTAASLALAKTVWNAGGIPAFCWHWKDPMQDVEAFYTEESGNTPYTEFGIGKAYDETTGQWKTESAEYQAIVRDLETVADALLQLQEAGVAVLWRPLHDASSRMFWWGTDGPKPCVALYRLMFDVFVNQKGLRNLVWVWTTEEWEDALAWYPGDDCVDVVGRDFYYYPRRSDHASLIDVFTAVRDLFGGRKIVALSENGSVPYPAEMEADGAHWSWFMPWYGDYAMEGWANDNTVDSWNTVMNDDYCLTLEDMPGWDNYTAHATTVVTSGVSRAYFLDTREEPRNSLGDETLTFSSLWDGGLDATVTIAQDGVAIAENLAGEGERAWSVPYNGTYELTHVTYTNGVAGKVETAKFVVTGKAEPPEITDVVATPSEPWDGRVSISFNVVNSPAAACPDWNRPYLSIVATDNVTGSNYVSVASALSGDTGAAGNGHAVTWDFKAQGIDFVSTNVTFTVAYLRMPDWCVIDLSGGKDAAHYPVTYVSNVPKVSNVPDVPGVTFNADAYKTTNLVMRLIGPEADGERPFYCAVFETTQRQWELVTGGRPSYFTNETCYASRPVEKVSWNMIRGDADTYNWPNVQGVDPESFLGVLRQKTDLDALDLPTEAQCEFACRAGTTTDYNNGKNRTGANSDANLDEVARYLYNGGYVDGIPDRGCAADHCTAAVGSYAPNAWGLYDFHGNVWEWCLDRYSSSGSNRVLRGGGWSSYADSCTSSYRYNRGPSYESNFVGFRLVRTLSNDLEGERSPEAEAGAERAGTVCAGASSAAIRVGKDFTADEFKLTGYAGTYDGEGHGIGIATNAIAGLELRYAVGESVSPGGLAPPSGGHGVPALPDWGDAPPTFTDVTNVTVWVEASAPGYFAFTTNATVTIAPRTVTLTSGSAEKVYDGTPVTCADVLVGAAGFAPGEGATFEVTGSQTHFGSSENFFTYALNDGTSAWNYEITTSNGTLTVTKATNAWTADPSLAGWTYGETAGVPDMGGAAFGTATVTYSAEPGDAGDYTATFTIEGTEDYDGLSFEVPFTIARATFAAGDIALADYEGVYDGEGHGIGIETNAIAGLVLRYAVGEGGSPGGLALPFGDTPPTFTDVTNVTVWVEASAPNYETVTNSATVKIAPRTVTDVEAEVILELPEGGYVGDGAAKEPAVSVLCGGRQLAAGVDYDIAYSDNVEPGTATVTVTFKGNYAGTATARFDIAEPEPEPQPEPEPPAERRVLWPTDAPFQLDRAATYNGYLIDTNANDAVTGMIAVKAGKPNKKTGASRLTVTIRLTGKKAIKVKGRTVDGTFRATAGGRTLDIALGRSSLSGAFGPYLVDGSRDLFAARDADSKSQAAQALERCRGKYVVAWKTARAGRAPYHTLTVAVKKKGRVTVRGTLADGTRVLTSTHLLVSGLRLHVNMGSRLLVGERDCAVAVSWTKKKASVACLLWFGENGTVSCESLPDGASAQVAPVGGGFAAGATLRVDQAAVAAAFPGFREDLSFPGGAPAKLKLKYKAKDGTFGGSFKVYVDNGRRVKSVTVKVSGVVLDGKGYGSAYVKKVGNWQITVE
ncbi:MAG: SUMF1/EgtB/PvdO family nonheme iron enzyme [Kiritimatiellae bacterium]|nr:SUMF1/EgtB/PvdO family nonheme iron enzyme [Kiritimatiellia bacterium]